MKQMLTLAVLLLAFYVPTAIAQESIEGDWAGGSNLFPNSYGFIKARFEKSNDDVIGFFNAQAWAAAKRPISNVRIESSKVHFEFPSTAGIPFVADGELKDGVIRGEIRRGDEKGEFHLVRVAPVNPQIYKDYVGAYRISPNDVRVVTWSAFGHLRTVAVEGNAGESDWLLPLGGDKFFFGSSVVKSAAPTAFATFNRNAEGRITGFTVHSVGKLLVTAPKTEWFKQEQVQFNNGKVKLAGTLLTPNTKLRHSAVVWVHGSQDRGRDDSIPFTVGESYLRLGIAVLVFDKRGVGGSSGDWHTSSFEDLAEDLLSGVRFLRNRNDINGKQIGLEGVSQGGWIAPIAAARDPKISFMVLVAAAGVSSKEQVTYDALSKARRVGVPENELKEAEEFLRLQFEASRSEKAWQQLQAMIPAVRDKKWFRFTLGGIPRTSWIWESTRLTSFFEPEPILRKIKCPVLLIFGGEDANYPAQRSAEIMERVLRGGGNRDVTAKIFPGADHGLLVRQADGKLIPAPDPDETKYNWLIKRVNKPVAR